MIIIRNLLNQESSKENIIIFMSIIRNLLNQASYKANIIVFMSIIRNLLNRHPTKKVLKLIIKHFKIKKVKHIIHNSKTYHSGIFFFSYYSLLMKM